MTLAGILSMLLSLTAVWALLITCLMRLCSKKDNSQGSQSSGEGKGL